MLLLTCYVRYVNNNTINYSITNLFTKNWYRYLTCRYILFLYLVLEVSVKSGIGAALYKQNYMISLEISIDCLPFKNQIL